MTDQEKRPCPVVPISDKVKWSCRAVLGDALSRCPEEADLIAIWQTPDGKLYWSKACHNNQAVYMMEAAKHKIIWGD